MKYRMLIKPFENCILERTSFLGQGHDNFSIKNGAGFKPYFSCDESNLPELLSQGIIEEIQEPCWTDRDMIDFAIFNHTTEQRMSVSDKFYRFKKERGL